MRSIRIKIMIIGAVSSFLMMVIALIVSYVMYYNGTKNEFLNNIDQVIDEVKFEVSNENYDADIFEVQNYVLENMPEESKEFSSEAEKRNYYREAFSQLYPAKSGTTGGMAFGFSRLTGQYTSVISFLRSKAIVTGSIVYLAYFDLDNNQIIYLGDSRDDENAIYYYTGSKYSIGNDIDNYVKQYEQTGRHDRMIIDGKTTKLTSLERNNQYLATIVVEYDLKVVSSVANEFLTTCLIIFSIGFVLLLILYFFLTHFLLINNLLKLNNATKEFSGLLSENKPNVINVKIRSHDEIKELSNSFETLENEIIEYSKRIEREALEREKINAELSIASRIQIETLPKNEYIDNNVILNAYIKPAKGVGGDFYDYFYVDNKLVVIISDVSGKGIPAALFMMKSKELLKSKITKASNLEDSIFDVNNELLENNAEGLFITAFVGIIDFDKLEFTYINCGHEKPYLISDNEIIRLGEESNFIIGGINDFKYKLEKIKLKENDKLFLFTDGLNESIDSNRIEFGYDNITNNLKENINNNNIEIINHMNDSLNEFTSSDDQFDDVTMLVISIKSNELHLNYKNPSFEIIEDAINKFNDKYSYIDKQILSEVNIIFDELLNNYISYEKIDNLEINIDTKIVDDELQLTFINNGVEFNPLLIDDKYIEEYSEDLKLGGFGITIVKNLSKNIEYIRKNNKNILIINKKFAPKLVQN